MKNNWQPIFQETWKLVAKVTEYAPEISSQEF